MTGRRLSSNRDGGNWLTGAAGCEPHLYGFDCHCRTCAQVPLNKLHEHLLVATVQQDRDAFAVRVHALAARRIAEERMLERDLS